MTCPHCGRGCVVRERLPFPEEALPWQEQVRCLECGWAGFPVDPQAGPRRWRQTYRERHRAQGLCIRCAAPAVTKNLCRRHQLHYRVLNTRNLRRFRARQRARRGA